MAFLIKCMLNSLQKQYEQAEKVLGPQMFSFIVLIDLRSIKTLLKGPEVNNNDGTWVRLKFFLCEKENDSLISSG